MGRMTPPAASLVALFVACASLAAQHAPAPYEDPRGIVIDEHVRPVAGAVVSLQWEQHDGVPFGRAIAARLLRSPLAATRSGRDGTWVLPVTNEQRQMGAPDATDSGCWLVVEKDGYVPWREPIPAGLPSYLGSRVVLRRVRAGDDLADLPWPPAVVAVKTERGLRPWLAPGQWNVDTSPRGGRAGGDGLAAVDAADAGELDVLVTAAGVPLPRAQLWFDDGAFALPAGAPPLPSETDADGCARARVPAGKRVLRVTAAGFMPADVTIDVARGGRTRSTIPLVAAFAIDVLALSDGKGPVAFRKLDIAPHDARPGRRPFAQFSDSQGRARVFVDEPAAWSVHGDRGAGVGVERVALGDPANVKGGIVRVTKHRSVTVRLLGDEWPSRGELRWEIDGAPPWQRAFKVAATDAAWVVCRLCFREVDVVTIGGEHGVPFRIRREDLPPMPQERMLDIVTIDRRLRTRAELVPPDEFAPLRSFLVQPPWQIDLTSADTIDYARQRDGKWWLMSRDDAPMDVVASALRMRPHPFTVPAAAGGEPLRIGLPMRRR